MRFVWTDAGDDPSWGIGDAHGIDGYYAPLFDSITPAVLDEAIRFGHAHGVYFGHAWMAGASPATIVARVAGEFAELVRTRPKLRLMWNLEEHDQNFVATVLEEWRKVQPKVNTSWSMEGMQGGWMGPTLAPAGVPPAGGFISRVLACRVRVVPQTFWGDMRPIAADQVLRDLTRRGFPESVVSCFYDARHLGDRWDGFAFTMGRLPA